MISINESSLGCNIAEKKGIQYFQTIRDLSQCNAPLSEKDVKNAAKSSEIVRAVPKPFTKGGVWPDPQLPQKLLPPMNVKFCRVSETSLEVLEMLKLFT